MENREYIDISFSYDDGMAIYPANPQFVCQKVSDMQKGDSCNVSRITLGTHTGTHIDAPSHFVQDGMPIDQLPLAWTNGRAKVLHIEEMVITVECLKKYEVEKDDIIIFRTSNSDVFEGIRVLESYVTLDYEGAQYLVDKQVKMIGIDYMTIERPRELREPGKSVHTILLGNGIPVLETLDLRCVEEGEYTLMCLPLKLQGSDGSPVRAVLIN